MRARDSRRRTTPSAAGAGQGGRRRREQDKEVGGGGGGRGGSRTRRSKNKYGGGAETRIRTAPDDRVQSVFVRGTRSSPLVTHAHAHTGARTRCPRDRTQKRGTDQPRRATRHRTQTWPRAMDGRRLRRPDGRRRGRYRRRLAAATAARVGDGHGHGNGHGHGHGNGNGNGGDSRADVVTASRPDRGPA